MRFPLSYGQEKPYLIVRFNAPLFGIWSPAKEKCTILSAFEPWYGRCDKADFTGELDKRGNGAIRWTLESALKHLNEVIV